MVKKPAKRSLKSTAADVAAQAESTDDGGVLTTAVVMQRHHHKVLRAVAFKRAAKSGGRASVSAILQELVEQHLAELEAEGRAFLDAMDD